MYLNSFIVLCYNCLCCMIDCFFFFKQKTAYEMRISDWSSDVCSSDLLYRIADGRLVVADAMRWRPWMAELDGDKLNQLVGKMLADLGGAYSVPTVRIGPRLGLFGSLQDRTSVGSGKCVSVRVALGGHRIIKKQNTKTTRTQ